MVSTINKTPLSFALGIVMAEYVLRLVPPGTHDFNRFIKPTDLKMMMNMAGLQTKNSAGLWFNPLLQQWSLMHETTFNSMEMNYIMAATKTSQ